MVEITPITPTYPTIKPRRIEREDKRRKDEQPPQHKDDEPKQIDEEESVQHIDEIV